MHKKEHQAAKISAGILKGLVFASAALTFLVLFFLIVYILVHGIPNLTPQLFAWKYTSENASMLPSIINTLIIVILSLVIAVPLGIFSAIYLVEYAKRGNKFVKIIRLTTETLSGIPSIVYGLFGALFFVTALKWGYSLLAGALTLSIMILPLIMRTTEEALKSVPDSFREGSFGLGAAGVILAVGRIIGETAALIYTAGAVAEVPSSIMGSGSTLAVHMYNLSREGLYMNQAYAVSVVLLIFVLLINWGSGKIAKKLTKGKE